MIGKTTLKEAASLVKYAYLHLGCDSWTNHATFAVNTLAVIIFGSTSPPGSGYQQNENIWHPEGCPWHRICYRELEDICSSRGCTDVITVQEVKEAVVRQIARMKMLGEQVKIAGMPDKLVVGKTKNELEGKGIAASGPVVKVVV